MSKAIFHKPFPNRDNSAMIIDSGCANQLLQYCFWVTENLMKYEHLDTCSVSPSVYSDGCLCNCHAFVFGSTDHMSVIYGKSILRRLLGLHLVSALGLPFCLSTIILL